MHPHPDMTARPAPPIQDLTIGDTEAIVRFIGGLDAPELWQRFLRFVTPAQVHDHFATLDWPNTIILGWLASDGICALAEVILYAGPWGLQAEIVVTVSLRRRGIGELRLEAAIDAATRRGAVRCLMVVHPGDGSMSLVRRHGGTVDFEIGLATISRYRTAVPATPAPPRVSQPSAAGPDGLPDDVTYACN